MRPLTLITLAALCLPAAASAQEGAEGIQWLDSYPKALAEAKRTGKPIFLEFRCEP